MKFRILIGLSLALLAFSMLQIFAQDQDDVRGAFLTSRAKEQPKSSASSGARPVRRRPRNVSKPKMAPTPGPANPADNPATGTVTVGPVVDRRMSKQKLGLGLTLFMRDANGLSMRVDPAREFRQGDRVRLLLETNVDGFLYVFNTTDSGLPTMIYPDPELEEGGNFIQAHVPVELPSSMAVDERLRWFRFDAQPGNERLYFVFAREPLATVPIEDDLINFCRSEPKSCPVRPSAQLWNKIQNELSTPLQTATVGGIGKPQTVSEHDATTRGIGLSKEDPEPTLIMMTASSTSGLLVAKLDLIHK